CDETCNRQLYEMRQLRTAQGKEMDRIERVWLITDDAPVPEQVKADYEGTHMLRVAPETLQAWLPVEQGANIADHMYMIDPRSNLMMRWPKDADPSRVKRDIGKLLRASSIG